MAMDDDERPSLAGDAAQDAAHRLGQEDLGPYSQDELNIRSALLEAELARVRAHRDKVSAHRAAADALFGGSKS
ncbi:MAG: DUF1192 domain-containing protein [Pseudomonadota bacterium]